MMAASTRGAPAITPEGRHHDLTNKSTSTSSGRRSVSFGLSTPIASSDTLAASSEAPTSGGGNNSNHRREETLRQYAKYRSAPEQFPSYERLRFVKLPNDWLPRGLRDATPSSSSVDANINNQAGGSSNSDDDLDSVEVLHHWPALVYENLAELVRDLSPDESKIVKAKLILEHRKCPNTVVARLLGWTQGCAELVDSAAAGTGGVGGGDAAPKGNPFEETKLELIRLSGSTLEENENAQNGELMNFVDGQLELEDVCDGVLRRYASAAARGCSSGSGSDDVKREGTNINTEVVKHALQFRRAVDMALNCLALDVGSDPLPPRNDDDVSLMQTPANGGSGGGATLKSGGAAVERKGVLKTPSSAMKKSKVVTNVTMGKEGVEEDTKKRVTVDGKKEKVEKSQPASVAAANTTSRRARSTTTATEKENQTNATSNDKKETKANTVSKGSASGGGGTRSRRESGTQTVPKKFQSPADGAANKKKRGTAQKAVDDVTMSASKSSAPSNAPASEEASIDDDEVEWKEVWATMKKSGWRWKGGSGLMTDYYYIKPGCKVKDGTEGIDYFVSMEDTQSYARTAYGWGEVSREVVMTNIAEYSKYAGEVVPPLEAVEEGGGGQAIGPNEPWRNAWQRLLQSGWTWKAGSGLMMDYYYVKPGCKIKGGIEGRDYFVTKEDVQKFCKRNYGWRGELEECVEVAKNDAKSEKRQLGRTRDEHQVKEKRQKVERAKPAAQKVAKNPATAEQPKDVQKPAKKPEPEEEEPMDDDRSTFSQSGFHSKTLFVDEVADTNVPPLKHSIDPNEPWRDAWQKMRNSGWSWKMGSGLMTDYYYIKPGCTVKGGVKGQDYFADEGSVRQFAMRNYGWRGDDSGPAEEEKSGGSRKRRNLSDEKSKDPTTTAHQEKKRQKVEKASKQSVQKKTPLPPPSNSYDKKALWQMMQQEGWKAINAGKFNKLHDWYYVRPNCDPGDGSSQLGVDYFLCEDDAIEWVQRTGGEMTAKKKSKDTTTPKVVGGMKQPSTAAKKVPSTAKKAAGGTAAADDGGLQTPADCRTKPQDPAIPLLSSPASSSPSTSSQDYYDWYKNLWPVLQRAGWKRISAGKYNKLHDWYWVRPGRDPGDESCELGRHYFCSEEDVIEFVRRRDAMDSAGGKETRKSMGVIGGAFEEAADINDANE